MPKLSFIMNYYPKAHSHLLTFSDSFHTQNYHLPKTIYEHFKTTCIFKYPSLIKYYPKTQSFVISNASRTQNNHIQTTPKSISTTIILKLIPIFKRIKIVWHIQSFFLYQFILQGMWNFDFEIVHFDKVHWFWLK